MHTTIETLSADFAAAIEREDAALRAVGEANGTPEFEVREQELSAIMDEASAAAARLLAEPARSAVDVLRKAAVLRRYGHGDAFELAGGTMIGGAQCDEADALDIRALHAIVSDMLALAA